MIVWKGLEPTAAPVLWGNVSIILNSPFCPQPVSLHVFLGMLASHIIFIIAL